MSRFRRGHRRRHGVRSTHFTQHDYIDVLTERRVKCCREVFRVDAHFALVDHRLFRSIDIFNGVFDGDDVFHALGVDEFDQGSQGRRLALPHWSHDEKEPLWFARECFNNFGKIEFFNRTNGLWDETQCDAHRPTLEKCVAAETVAVRRLVCKVYFMFSKKALFLFRCK